MSNVVAEIKSTQKLNKDGSTRKQTVRKSGIQPWNKTVQVEDLKALANEFLANPDVTDAERQGIVLLINSVLTRTKQHSGFAIEFQDGVPTLVSPLQFL
jgi:hypothetical protein